MEVKWAITFKKTSQMIQRILAAENGARFPGKGQIHNQASLTVADRPQTERRRD